MTYKVSTYDVEKLSDHANILAGFAFKSERFLVDDSQVPLVKGENVHQGYIDWSAAKYWPSTEYEFFKKYQLRAGDVVVAMDRPWVTAGLKWSYIREHDPKSLLVQRVARLRAKKGLDQTYLRCLISSSYFGFFDVSSGFEHGARRASDHVDHGHEGLHVAVSAGSGTCRLE